jgi:hypothetical protein
MGGRATVEKLNDGADRRVRTPQTVSYELTSSLTGEAPSPSSSLTVHPRPVVELPYDTRRWRPIVASSCMAVTIHVRRW